MGIPDKYTVQAIRRRECKEWLLGKHYAKRIPPISYAFGLFTDDILQGICTFGIPASRFDVGIQPYELNRLVVNDGLEKNALSYFVSQCLRNFPEEAIIVSYADTNQGHHGYIYQATNWLYTGSIDVREEFVIDGQRLHCKTVYNKYGTSGKVALGDLGVDFEMCRENLPKHRYFWCSTKKLRKAITDKYPLMPYPKGENTRYDASYEPVTQGILF